jgi:uncharacterized membrane protein
MNSSSKKRIVLIVLSGLVAGGLCGAGVGLNFYSPLVGVPCTIIVSIIVGYLVYRTKHANPSNSNSSSPRLDNDS